MTEPAGRAHDFAVEYLEHDLGDVAIPFTQRNAADGRGVIVEGHCPRCQGRTVTEYPRGVPGSGTKGMFWRLLNRATAGVDVLATEVLYCECGYLHPNQPADPVFLGCGASWRVHAPAASEEP